jgi:alpha-galactosidase
MTEVVHLRTPGLCSLLLDCSGPALPRVLHWGADLGDLPTAALDAIAVASTPDIVHGPGGGGPPGADAQP